MGQQRISNTEDSLPSVQAALPRLPKHQQRRHCLWRESLGARTLKDADIWSKPHGRQPVLLFSHSPLSFPSSTWMHSFQSWEGIRTQLPKSTLAHTQRFWLMLTPGGRHDGLNNRIPAAHVRCLNWTRGCPFTPWSYLFIGICGVNHQMGDPSANLAIVPHIFVPLLTYVCVCTHKHIYVSVHFVHILCISMYAYIF